MLSALRAARRRAAAAGSYEDLVAELDRVVARVEAMLDAAKRTPRLVSLRGGRAGLRV